jgi:hypothetical protein
LNHAFCKALPGNNKFPSSFSMGFSIAIAEKTAADAAVDLIGKVSD